MIILLTGKKELQKKAIREICEQQNLDASSIQHFYVDDFSDFSFEQKIPVNTGLFGERECFVRLNDPVHVARQLLHAVVVFVVRTLVLHCTWSAPLMWRVAIR